MSFFDKLQNSVNAHAEQRRHPRGAGYFAQEQKAELKAPPRHFSIVGKLSILLHSTLIYIGLGFFGMGFLFTVLMLRLHWAYEELNASGTWTTTTGTITQYEKQRSSGKNSSTTHYYDYEYTVAGKTYTHKAGISTNLNKDQGDTLSIDYLDTKPEITYINGHHPSSMIIGAYLGAPFLIISFFLLYFGFRRTRRNLHLYQHGIFTKGKMLSSESTNETVNKQRVFKYQFSFTTPDGKQHTVETKTHLTHKVEDEEEEFILYEPDAPAIALVYDAEEYTPLVENDGSLRARFKVIGFILLFICLACIAGALLIPAKI